MTVTTNTSAKPAGRSTGKSTTGKSICVTGTASGIGRATREHLEAAGFHVIGVDRHDADVVGDLARAEDRTRMVEEVLDACGGVLDGLVPCAGLSTPHPDEMIVRVNYYGTMEIVRGLRSALSRGDGASLVMISSNSTTMTPGLRVEDAMVYLDNDEETAVRHFGAAPPFTAYPAGKLAIAYWVRQNAAAWLADGIRVNGVAPGVIDTNMVRPLLDIPGVKDSLDRVPIPLGRWGRPEEIASVIGFLVSSQSSYIVGQVLFADGGTDALLQPFAHPHPLPGPGRSGTEHHG
jgi:NAD(P)-dependent dehydrogenase (short-subunit alcohol dehydrogenase family)